MQTEKFIHVAECWGKLNGCLGTIKRKLMNSKNACTKKYLTRMTVYPATFQKNALEIVY